MHTLMQFTETGPYRPMNEEGTKPVADCAEGDGYVFLAGSGITDASGNWSLNVRDAICVGLYIIDDVSMVATPTFNPFIDSIQPPHFISTAWAGNLTLFVRTHAQNGDPAGGVRFDWHATILHHLELKTAAER